MENRLSIENVTNGLLTLQKLKQLYKPAKRQEGDDSLDIVQPDRLSLIQETLSSITDFLPETRGGSLTEALRQGSHYSNAYRGIKQHVRNINMSNLDSTQLINGLKLVVPILNNEQRLYVDKVVKIFDIMYS